MEPHHGGLDDFFFLFICVMFGFHVNFPGCIQLWRGSQILSQTKSEGFLVGGFNQFEKYARQIGSFPQGSG